MKYYENAGGQTLELYIISHYNISEIQFLKSLIFRTVDFLYSV